MNWLITGGCGFIGSQLVDSLAREGGHNVRVFDNLSAGSQDVISPLRERRAAQVAASPTGVELIVGDVRDIDAMQAAASGVDVIVHLAANTGVQPSIADPVSDCVTNVLGTLHALEGARTHGVPRFVFASSGGTVIGDAEPPIHEDLLPKPKSPYGASKSASEGYLCAYHRTFGIDTVALRFSNVYGPGSVHKNSVVARFIRSALGAAPLEIYGTGNQTRDFIYVADIVKAVRAAACVPGIGGEVFQVATGVETSITEVAGIVVDELVRRDLPARPIHHGPALAGEVQRNFCDTTKATARLDWSAETDVREGVRRTVDWFVAERGGSSTV